MNIFNSFWGLLALVMIAAIVFVQAQKIGGTSGGDQSATIIKAAGGAGSQLVSALETGSPAGAGGVYG